MSSHRRITLTNSETRAESVTTRSHIRPLNFLDALEAFSLMLLTNNHPTIGMLE
jgi:hypothetical protein